MTIVERDGVRIAYQRTGAGPTVLWVQGVGVIGNGWRPQVEAISHRHTCVTFDNRGLGESSRQPRELSIESLATDALAVLDAERLERAHVVGHSMGGVIAQQLALVAPQRVRSLAMLCSFRRGRDGTTLDRSMLWTAIKSRVGPRRVRRLAFLEMIAPPATRAAFDLERELVALAELFGHDLADQPPVVMRQLRAMARFDAGSRLRELASIPTLVLSGELDRIAPPVSGRALAAAIPGARYVELAGAGHAAPIHRAGEINALLAEHFAASEGSARSAPVPARPITPSAG
ncbi:MAG: alpha/beta fold hydrolase [Deltaproteobacteria bacterium]|nr:alpha/beta fold hydrolase [Deltaproteobacteria bacterium]